MRALQKISLYKNQPIFFINSSPRKEKTIKVLFYPTFGNTLLKNQKLSIDTQKWQNNRRR